VLVVREKLSFLIVDKAVEGVDKEWIDLTRARYLLKKPAGRAVKPVSPEISRSLSTVIHILSTSGGKGGKSDNP
jgi:hypothetical protein